MAKENKDTFHTVIPTDDRIMPISTDEGTGMVHTAVSAGTEDYKLGKTKKYPSAHPAFCQRAALGVPKNSNIAKHKAMVPPSIKPFVLKFGVGIQGSIIGNKIAAASIAKLMAKAGIIPPSKNVTITITSIGKKRETNSTGTKINLSLKGKYTRLISEVAL